MAKLNQDRNQNLFQEEDDDFNEDIKGNQYT